MKNLDWNNVLWVAGNPCSPVSSFVLPSTGDGITLVVYDFGSIGAGARKTVKIGYQVQ